MPDLHGRGHGIVLVQIGFPTGSKIYPGLLPESVRRPLWVRSDKTHSEHNEAVFRPIPPNKPRGVAAQYLAFIRLASIGRWRRMKPATTWISGREARAIHAFTPQRRSPGARP